MHRTRVFACVAVAGLLFAFASAALGDPDMGEIKRIAALLKKGDKDGAKKAATTYAKNHAEIEDLMIAFSNKKGLGVGALNKKGFGAGPIGNAAAQEYEDLGYNIAAVGLITEALAPEKNLDMKRTRKAWLDWASGMTDAGTKLAAAAKAKNPADLQKHAGGVNANCNSCHTVFR